MCKRRSSVPVRRDLPWEGETIRLDRRVSVAQEQATTEQPDRTARWPIGWWMLWLIWPLSGLVKWLAPVLASALATISQLTLSVPLLVPLVLIVVGLVLLRRS